jgi:hypothetical protein
VRRAHEAVLDDLREPARRALATLSAKLPDAPTSVVETYRWSGAGSTREVLVAGPFQVGNGRLIDPPELVLWSLLDGAGTPLCTRDVATEEERQRYLAARQVAAAWLIGDLPAASPQAPRPSPAAMAPAFPASEAALKTLRGLPAGEQRARVAAFREAELTCAAGDRMDILTGPYRPDGPR